MKNETKIKFGARGALFSAALIWGSSFFIMKNAVDSLPPNYLLAIRFTTACIFLSIIFHKKLKLINREYIKSSFVIGLFLFLAYFTQTVGLTDTTPGKNAFLTAVYCIIVPFLFWAVKKDKPDFCNFMAALLCMVGIGLVSLGKGLTISFGDTFTLIGGFFFAAHMVAVAVLSQGKDPILITIMQFGFSGIFSWIMGFCFEIMPPPSAWDVGMVAELLYLTFLATAAALLLQNIGQKYTDPSAAAIILSLESVFGILFSIIFYGERLTPKLTFGFIIIFIAVLISETRLSFLKSACKKTKV